MPSYFYRIRFELYPTPRPNDALGESGNTIAKDKSDSIWLPPINFDVFRELPAHSRSNATVSNKWNIPPPNNSAQTGSTADPFRLARSPDGFDDLQPRTAGESENFSMRSERQPSQYCSSNFLPHLGAFPQSLQPTTDWRFDKLSIVGLEMGRPVDRKSSSMEGTGETASAAATTVADVGPSLGSTGQATKAKFTPVKTTKTHIGWGIVHLFREGDETPQLDTAYEDTEEDEGALKQLDCTTVCIPAVPSYLSPGDFLGFIGDRWTDHISHYRIVMTSRMNRYLVLMKFRDSKRALAFRREFDGKVFIQIEPETCTVAFIKSITFEKTAQPTGSFPDLSRDPFTPASTSSAASSKPLPPPTPRLIELPTCPVCLERMDDTTGLLTIPCQHVFHCSCLEKWKGSGCPVCRHTNPSHHTPGPDSYSSSSVPYDPSNPYTQPFGSQVSNLCSVCDSPDDLWICLICGNVGCGRYRGGHAKEHWKDTAHTFSLELDTQHVWDYAGDMWVHRLIRDKGDGKVVELPDRADNRHGRGHAEDVVPRAKLESISMEYTHLLTSQLESQRVYFEEMLSKAADKAVKASVAAQSAAAQAAEALKELRSLKDAHRNLEAETIPSLERDLTRERNRANKSTELARGLSKTLQEERKVGEGLMKRIDHVNKEIDSLTQQVKTFTAENADLKDQNHDLTMFISGQEKLREMEADGQVAQAELQEGSASVPEGRRRKGKGKVKS